VEVHGLFKQGIAPLASRFLIVYEHSVMIRCPWVGKNKSHYEHYHDTEWGIPVRDDQKHFEMLILEGAQAGLSWETILKRREGYREAFKQFDITAVASMSDADLEALLTNPGIIRNRLKVFSARQNARVFIAIQQEFGSFDAYVWRFVNGKSKINRPKSLQEVPSSTHESEALSRDLKKRGMRFVGSTIMYAYMQAVGMVDDHIEGCFRYQT
jgi:DNA-3-methyladenine glycosylase I